MLSKYTRNQKTLMAVVPVLVTLSTVIAIHVFGPSGLGVPLILGVSLIVILIIEFRSYQLDLFVRQQSESRAVFAQLEAYIGIVETLRPVLPLPATRGWAASPDFLREIMTQVLTEPTEMVVEASSGVSTLVIAYCLKKRGQGRVIALEHDPVYAERTRRTLRDHGLEEHGTVVDAPLVSHSVNDRSMLWYDLRRAGLIGPIDLLVVDGPPDTTQLMARYPALPLLLPLLAPEARVLLDDGDRPDERAAVERWIKDDPGMMAIYLYHEGGAWLLRRGARNI